MADDEDLDVAELASRFHHHGEPWILALKPGRAVDLSESLTRMPWPAAACETAVEVGEIVVQPSSTTDMHAVCLERTESFWEDDGALSAAAQQRIKARMEEIVAEVVARGGIPHTYSPRSRAGRLDKFLLGFGAGSATWWLHNGVVAGIADGQGDKELPIELALFAWKPPEARAAVSQTSLDSMLAIAAQLAATPFPAAPRISSLRLPDGSESEFASWPTMHAYRIARLGPFWSGERLFQSAQEVLSRALTTFVASATGRWGEPRVHTFAKRRRLLDDWLSRTFGAAEATLWEVDGVTVGAAVSEPNRCSEYSLIVFACRHDFVPTADARIGGIH